MKPIGGGDGGGGGWDSTESDPKTPRVLTALSQVLERLIARNDDLLEEWIGGDDALHGFRGAKAPGISVAKYLERMHRFTSCSPSCFVVAFAYVDRLVHLHPGSRVVSTNVHRLIVTGVLIASKVLDDLHDSNQFFARVGGVTKREMNRMELEMLFLLDFKVSLSPSVFKTYCEHLEKELRLAEVDWKSIIIGRFMIRLMMSAAVAAVETSRLSPTMRLLCLRLARLGDLPFCV
ncbi:Cyclin-U1-1 [Acorus calamus]|uniref:Cyclin-U1-1 n=1 Tax=Acorus calamus TaxID=4465 RepID=A0AAV9C4Q7_ACOCL|nr:Cyclin-U1-1 [Acorus calamus]